MTDREQHPHTTNGRGGAVRRAPAVVTAGRPRDYERAATPVVEERVGPPPGRPSFGLTRRSR